MPSHVWPQVAKPRTVMNILKQAYGDNKAAVNDELVQCVLQPGLQVWAPRLRPAGQLQHLCPPKLQPWVQATQMQRRPQSASQVVPSA